MRKKFFLGDVLSVTTGKLISPLYYDGVWELLSFMKGENLPVDRLNSVRPQCRAFLLDQFPQLRDIDAREVTPANFRTWLDERERELGEALEVEPLPKARKEVVERFGVKIGRFLP